MVRTGTDDAPAGPAGGKSGKASGKFVGSNMSLSGTTGDNVLTMAGDAEIPVDIGDSQCSSGDGVQAGAGFEPATNGFAIRPIRPLWHPAVDA